MCFLFLNFSLQLCSAWPQVVTESQFMCPVHSEASECEVACALQASKSVQGFSKTLFISLALSVWLYRVFIAACGLSL